MVNPFRPPSPQYLFLWLRQVLAVALGLHLSFILVWGILVAACKLLDVCGMWNLVP